MKSIRRSLTRSPINRRSDDVKHQRAWEIVSSIGQQHLLSYWDTLTARQKDKLSKQIESLDLATLQEQKDLLGKPQTVFMQRLSPFTPYSLAGNPNDYDLGKKLIAAGQVGCLVVAGGQGTRLRFDGPKGICPVTLLKKKSLFQLIAEKTLAAGHQAGHRLHIAIMTSPGNHRATTAFFEDHHYFNLDPSQIRFFQQQHLPLLDKDGNLFLESRDTIYEGPDGNGGALHEFTKQGIWEHWHKQGIRYVNFILVDNPLADPFDAELVGFHHRKASDVVVKATFRRDAHEKVGVLAKENHKSLVVEYSELNPRDRDAIDTSGQLRYCLANLSLFSFTMDFVKSVTGSSSTIPLHKAFKAVKYLDKQGNTIQADSPMAWKFEKFIFDIFCEAKAVDALVYPREACFAPLKNFSGSDSLETVPYAIEASDRRVISAITGTPCEVSPIEISQDFYYPTPSLLNKWQGKEVTTTGYIEE